MKVLVVAATGFEIAPARSVLEKEFEQLGNFHFGKHGLIVRVLHTGIGATLTAWHLSKALARETYNLVINAGVAGAFDRSLQLGTVVQISDERFGDLGVEEANGQFTDVFDLGLQDHNQPPFANGILYNPGASVFSFLPKVKGLTVNCVHGTATSIGAIQTKYPEAQIETMESAAVFYGCLLENIPFIGLRSISNYVEPRNRDAWELGLAIEHLNTVLVEMLQTLTPPAP